MLQKRTLLVPYVVLQRAYNRFRYVQLTAQITEQSSCNQGDLVTSKPHILPMTKAQMDDTNEKRKLTHAALSAKVMLHSACS